MRWTMVVAALAASGCVSDSGEPSTLTDRTYALSGFDGVELFGPDDVRVSVGPGFSVRATGPASALDRLDVIVKDNRLLVRRKGQSFGRTPAATVFVTLPTLTAASLRGSGDLLVDRIDGQAFAAAVSGSGDLTIERVAVDRLTGAVAGSGTLSLAGSARELDANVAGSGDIAAGALTVERAQVSVMGSGDVRAAVRGDATVSVMGSGNVDLGQDARCTVSKMGSGAVRCGG